MQCLICHEIWGLRSALGVSDAIALGSHLFSNKGTDNTLLQQFLCNDVALNLYAKL